MTDLNPRREMTSAGTDEYLQDVDGFTARRNHFLVGKPAATVHEHKTAGRQRLPPPGCVLVVHRSTPEIGEDFVVAMFVERNASSAVQDGVIDQTQRT